METTMQQRRTFRRTDFNGWVEVTTSRQRSRGTANDLSVGGVGVLMPAPLPAATTAVTSEFALPGISLPLALEGVVAWSDPGRGRFGVRFERVDPGLAELLASYVAGRF
jgi:c-di-GMP-binding flagellar brake protein YcgR